MTSAPDQPRITLVCCGLLGCLVSDEGLIERSYAEAIATQGVVSGTSAFARRMAQVHQGRGQAPGDVLRLLFPDNEARALAARLSFDRALGDALHRFEVKPAPGVIEALARLRGAGRTVCVLSGFPEQILDAVLGETGLRRHIDLALTVADAPRGFPAPDLVLMAMLRTGADAVSAVAVTDATSAGVAAGHRAGAGFVAGLLTGPHASARLKLAGADVVLRSFAALPEALPVTPAEAPVAGSEAAAPGPAGSIPGQHRRPQRHQAPDHQGRTGSGAPPSPPVSVPVQTPRPRGAPAEPGSL